MDKTLILLTGFILGLRHAFDPDHIAAVTHFISVDPRPQRGAVFGLKWGVGHTVTVFALASFVILMGWKLTGRFERYTEIGVGVTLIVLALWRLWLLWKRPHSHPHQHGQLVHDHPHTHAPQSGHVHAHAPTLVGMLHGAAGTAGLQIVIASLNPSTALAFLYILLFSLGTIFAMSGYGFLAAYCYQRTAAAAWQRAFTALVGLTAMAGLALGVWWIAKNLIPST